MATIRKGPGRPAPGNTSLYEPKERESSRGGFRRRIQGKAFRVSNKDAIIFLCRKSLMKLKTTGGNANGSKLIDINEKQLQMCDVSVIEDFQFAHILQDLVNRQVIVCDVKLKKIFRRKQRVGFLEVARLLSPHMLK